ncbi:hypothetical protein [Maioricimonas sp. JC845]
MNPQAIISPARTALDEFAQSPTHIEPLQSVDHGNNVIDDGERR